MPKRKRRSVDLSKYHALDKWMTPPLEEVKSTADDVRQKACVFIHLPEILDYFAEQDKILDYGKLMDHLKSQYGADTSAHMYLGAYPERDLSAQDAKKQSRFFQNLSTLGYTVVKGNVFVRDNRKIVVKGTEVSLGVDMIRYLHPNRNEFDLAVLFCGDEQRFRKLLQMVKSDYNAKVKVLSLAYEYEENLQSFKEFVQSISTVTPTSSQWNFRPNIRTYKRAPSDSVKMFTTPKTTQDRLRRKSQMLREKALGNGVKKKTILYADYGNLYHNLRDLKKLDIRYRDFTDESLLMLLKTKAEARNQLEKAKVFMGVPSLNIKNLESIRKKKEELYESLRSHGFEVHFSNNEVLFGGGMKESDVDLRIGIDIARSVLDNDFEKYVLVSGDADFVPVVRMLKEYGKQVEIWAFTEDSLSPFLIEEITNLSDTKCGIKSILEMIR